VSVPESRRYATTRPKLAARRARRHRATRARTLAARIRVESARANVFTMMASSLGSSLAPVAGAHRARRGPRASRATSPTASDSSSRLDALLGEDLGDAVRTSLRRRDAAAAIDAAVASLERDSPTDHPVASPLLDGDWKLRYTTSAGTVGSVGAWETFVGAVFDVRQTCARRPDGAGVAITNIVTVRVPAPPAPPMPFPTIPIPDRPVAVRITQTFAAEATSRRRLETKLRESVVDVLRGNADEDEGDASVRVPDASVRESDASVRVPDASTSTAFGGIFAAPIRIAAAAAETLANSLGASATSSKVAASFTQSGADAQPPKRQQITHLSERWRVTRDDASYSVYSRIPTRPRKSSASAEEARHDEKAA